LKRQQPICASVAPVKLHSFEFTTFYGEEFRLKRVVTISRFHLVLQNAACSHDLPCVRRAANLTDVAEGGIDPYSEGPTVSAAGPWSPTYSLGPGHPWQERYGGVIALSWINVYPSFFEGLNTVSWLRIPFTMPAHFTSASMNLKMKADNRGDIAINGHWLATISAGAEFNFGVSSPQVAWLKPGMNEITMKLADVGYWVAIILFCRTALRVCNL
jgi:hypothetical protein